MARERAAAVCFAWLLRERGNAAGNKPAGTGKKNCLDNGIGLPRPAEDRCVDGADPVNSGSGGREGTGRIGRK
eukprot:11217385-Lingulodinium_polyedra.AAC.1